MLSLKNALAVSSFLALFAGAHVARADAGVECENIDDACTTDDGKPGHCAPGPSDPDGGSAGLMCLADPSDAGPDAADINRFDAALPSSIDSGSRPDGGVGAKPASDSDSGCNAAGTPIGSLASFGFAALLVRALRRRRSSH